MNIVYNCNDKFAVHTAVSITSLFENNRPADEINVYILGNSLSEVSIGRLKAVAERYDCEGAAEGRSRSVEIIELKDYETAVKMLFGGEVNAGRFDLTVLARLFAPSHLPENVERFIYLDADTIVTGDIMALYEAELAGNICMMAAEPTIYEDTREQLGLGGKDSYFNSGMMLVDRIAWEKEKISGACIDYYMSKGRRGLAFPDQDIINYVLKGRILTAWQGYNFFSNYYYQSYESLCKRAEWYGSRISKKDYEHAKAAPAVVHFAGSERPWYKGNHNPYREAYRKYLLLSGWLENGQKPESLEESGHEREMLVYHIMNVMTQLCPPSRELISKLYYKTKLKRK